MKKVHMKKQRQKRGMISRNAVLSKRGHSSNRAANVLSRRQREEVVDAVIVVRKCCSKEKALPSSPHSHLPISPTPPLNQVSM